MKHWFKNIFKRRMFHHSRMNLYSGVFLVMLGNSILPQCNSNLPIKSPFPYNIHKPDQEYILEQKLSEVSGLSFVSATEAALIQDEAGAVFIYDFQKQAITKKINFSKKGDYEDLKVINDSAYILRSDGTLYEVNDLFSQSKPPEKKLDTPLSQKNDTEGLTYDDQKNRLLIACKGSPELKGSKKEYKDKKAIYSFDLATLQLSDTPVVLIDADEIDKIAKGNYTNAVQKLISFYNRTGVIHEFEPSGICIHPQTRELYVISSVGRLLVIINPEGRVTNVIRLPQSIFKQPEGIAFDAIGNLYISNEGRNGKGNILKFNIQKNGLEALREI